MFPCRTASAKGTKYSSCLVEFERRADDGRDVRRRRDGLGDERAHDERIGVLDEDLSDPVHADPNAFTSNGEGVGEGFDGRRP